LKFRIIKIIIQPIIENAIYHGIKQLAGSGLIEIKVLEHDNTIQFIIQDNGVGMEEDVVLHLLDRSDNSNKNGIGVSNVDERIKLYYGQNFGVTIESGVFEGTKVILTVPKEYNREDYTSEEF
jgi:two-component system sensor histidine kinase YesM